MSRALRLLVVVAVLGTPKGAPYVQTASRPLPQATSDTRQWIQLFNGRDLADWTIKFAKHDLGENFRNTFRVEDGLLKVRYDQWPSFNGEFGHIFYKDPFSYYLLAAEYRFVGEQVTGAPSWAIRNNGLMLHSPQPAHDAPGSGLSRSRSRSSCSAAWARAREPPRTSARREPTW